jgi:hypothetical protein
MFHVSKRTPHTVALYDDQTFRDFTSFSFIQANWSRRLLPRGSQGERCHLWSKCVFELSKFSYDTMQLSTVTGNLESRDAIISKDYGCFKVVGYINDAHFLRDIRRYEQNSSLLNVNATVAKNGEEEFITKHPIISENGEKQNIEKALPSSDACVGTSFRKHERNGQCYQAHSHSIAMQNKPVFTEHLCSSGHDGGYKS